MASSPWPPCPLIVLSFLTAQFLCSPHVLCRSTFTHNLRAPCLTALQHSVSSAVTLQGVLSREYFAGGRYFSLLLGRMLSVWEPVVTFLASMMHVDKSYGLLAS